MSSPYSVDLIVDQLTVEMERIGFKLKRIDNPKWVAQVYAGLQAVTLYITAKDEWSDTLVLVDKPIGGIFANHYITLSWSNEVQGRSGCVTAMYTAVESIILRTGERLLKGLGK